MKHRLLALLLALNVLLLLGLALMWYDPQAGAWRNLHWQAPAPLAVPITRLAPSESWLPNATTANLVATLDRPLFAPNRRPPPPPAKVEADDLLDKLQLLGVFAAAAGADGKATGGILARVNGKAARLKLGDSVGAWTLKQIQNRDVTFVRGPDTRVLNLAYTKPAAPAAGVATPPPMAMPGAMPNPPAAPSGMLNQNAQRIEDETRQRLLRLQNLRPQ